jgi:hypothetical protein
LRAVQDGSLDRFGSRSIRPRAGERLPQHRPAELSLRHDVGGRFFANAYAQYYRFDLFTNFTFFQNDPVNGDGFQQSDRRVMYGGDIGYKQTGRWFDMDGAATVGVQTRVDHIHARLGPQVLRNPLGSTSDTDITEASYAPFFKLEVQPTPWMRLAGGVRSEVFTFDVRNRCADLRAQPAGRRVPVWYCRRRI